jgi:3-methyladenine DNA glycosylase AlkD
VSEELDRIRSELREAVEPDRVEALQSFFRTGPGEYAEGDVLIGVRVPETRRIARAYRDLPLSEALELLGSEIHEERLLALLIMVDRFRRDAGAREDVFEAYLAHTNRVNNWDLVDLTAPAIVGAWLENRPRDVLDRLARSDLLWDRRIAIVATHHLIRRGEFDDTLRICEALLGDGHHLIHKACGWMLREVGKRDERLMVGFIEAHAAEMPRTMLRYAIERLPRDERRRLMAIR